MQYNNVLLIHHSSWSPFPAGEGMRVSAKFLVIQRTPFKFNPFKADWNVFI
jgi:hypothetical protein